MEKKQTAVEWLIERFQKYTDWIEGDPRATEYTLTELFNDFEQAKKMEKEQIMESFSIGIEEGIGCRTLSPKQYYNETYGKQTDRS